MAPREVIVEAPEFRLDPLKLRERVDWQEIFGNDNPVEFELGIGKGRFLIAAAEARPDVNHIGIEWANKYLRFAESRAKKRGLTNMRFARLDVHEMIDAIPDRSVRVFYVFYPDPWPKKRHKKRRFLRKSNADQMARILVPRGHLHVATDHDEYWEQIEEVFEGHEAYERLPEFGGDAFPVPSEGAMTNFEEKYEVEGRNRHRASWRLR